MTPKNANWYKEIRSLSIKVKKRAFVEYNNACSFIVRRK